MILEEISEKKIILENFSWGDPQSYLIWQEENGWLDSFPKIFAKWIQKKSLKRRSSGFRGFLIKKFPIIFGLPEMKWMIRFFIKKSSSNDSRRNLWKENYFRIFLFRRSSIIFDLAGRKWMIRFFVKKSSPNESRKNLQKEGLQDPEDFSLGNFQSYLACQKWNEWLDSSPKNLRPMILDEISEKKIILEYFSLGDPQSYFIWQEGNGWLDSSPINLRQMNPEKIFKEKIFRIQRISH